MKLRQVKLKDICVGGKGSYGIPASAVPRRSDLYTYLRITDITDDGRLNAAGLMSVEDEAASKYLLSKNDIVFARTGASTGRNYFYSGTPQGLVYAGFLIKFSLDPKLVFPPYVKYYCLSDRYKAWVAGHSVGSTRGNCNAQTFSEVPILLPAIPVQRKVAEILESYDDLIDNCECRIALLEKMARSIYRSWFVNFQHWGGRPPAGLKRVTLGDLVSRISTGLNPRKNFRLGEGENYYVTIKNMTNNTIVLDDKCDKVSDDAIRVINKRSDLRQGDLLFSGIGTIGRVALIFETPQNWNTSESVFNLRPADGVSSEYLYFVLVGDEVQTYVISHALGVAQKGIRKADLVLCPAVFPDARIMTDFSNQVAPYLELQNELRHQMHNLSMQRDRMMSRVFSGKIDFDALIGKEEAHG